MAADGFGDLSRRGVLAGAAAMTGGTALAQNAPAPRAKGPIVWLDMDQKALDDAYDRMQRSDVKYRFVIDNASLARG